MRRLLLKLTWFLPLALLIAGVNYGVDPANLFHEAALERQAAAWLASGQNVEGLSDFDERKFQQYWLEGLSTPPDTVVLGSSRAMTLTGPQLYNHFVSGGVLPDYLALSQLYREKGWHPRRLVLVVDPWLFNRKNHEPRWKSLTGAYARARQALGLNAQPGWLSELTYRAEIYSQLLSPSYFQASLEKLFKPSQAPARPTTADEGEKAVKRRDGSLQYGLETTRGLTGETVRQSAIQLVEKPPVYGLEQYQELDPELQHDFEALLADWKRQGTEVVLILAPYHPESYRRLAASPRFAQVGAVERYLRTLPYRVEGSYEPHGLGDGDFYDGQHPRPGVVRVPR